MQRTNGEGYGFVMENKEILSNLDNLMQSEKICMDQKVTEEINLSISSTEDPLGLFAGDYWSNDYRRQVAAKDLLNGEGIILQ